MGVIRRLREAEDLNETDDPEFYSGVSGED